MRLHTDRILFQIPVTLFTGSKLARYLLMFFNLVQGHDLQAVGVILAPDLCQFEDFGKLGAIHNWHKL